MAPYKFITYLLNMQLDLCSIYSTYALDTHTNQTGHRPLSTSSPCCLFWFQNLEEYVISLVQDRILFIDLGTWRSFECETLFVTRLPYFTWIVWLYL